MAGSHFVDLLVVMSLAGEVSDRDAEELMQAAGNVTGGDRLMGASANRLGLSVISKEFVAAVVRDAFRTPRGREYARKILFHELPLTEHVAAPFELLVNEGLVQGAFPQDPSPEQAEIAWQAACEVYQGVARTGKIENSQLLQLVLAWKGVTNLFGWAGVAPSLEPGFRGKLAYIMGHRYLKLGKSDDAKALFRTAVADAPKGSPLARLAQADLDLLSHPPARPGRGL